MAFNLENKYIKYLENQLQSDLPSQYKNEMMVNNGGVIFINDEDWELFPIEDTSDRKRISRTANHVLKETKKASEWSLFSSNFLAIASNGMGDLMIFIKEQNIYLDDVYIWRHETGQFEKAANSFDELDIE